MKRNVLIVDDDRILRRLIQKKFEAHSEHFSTLLAEDGTAAVRVLKENSVSLVVTDLQMPEMDGFALLAYLSAKYPDIPVIVLTAFATPQSQKKVLERGAAGFMVKPFVVEDLAKKILAALAKEREGGILQTVSLEMYIQLVEMEQKTCTLRVINKDNNQPGVLFFKQGQLMDARISDLHGLEVAHEILGWDKVSLSIEDTCVISEKLIPGELQAILFDAMRQKDESSATPDDFMEPEVPSMTVSTTPEKPQMATSPNRPSVLQNRIAAIVADTPCIKPMDMDDSWKSFLGSIQNLGDAVGAGDLKSCYLNFGNNRRVVLIGDTPPAVLRFSEECPRDVIRQLLYEWRQ
ncbi:MAG: response regulator [Pseudomonadota bacterium]